ncbi:hypothetical protein QR680_012331 [Steinernema hermaphroditum]|uniref:Uncharacterized protein n=1 Tax=Steinernema hermaphroditum TaxID=289476 RepID=A0AA39M0L3_9BILA|nr:hypothetical protein QR680_012331 [Steinernema hermaphroditum]
MPLCYPTYYVGPFDHYNPQYMCCCGSMHARKAAFYAACLAMAVVVLSLIGIAVSFSICGVHSVNVSLGVIAFIGLLCILLMFEGLRKEAEEMLVPPLILSVAFMAVKLMALVIVLVTTVFPNNPVGHYIMSLEYVDGDLTSLRFVCGAIAVVIVLVFAVVTWFMRITFLCYRYFTDLNEYRANLVVGSEVVGA